MRDRDTWSDLPLLVASIYVAFQNYFDDVHYREMHIRKADALKQGAMKPIPYNS